MAKDDDYGPGSKKWPQTPGKPWQLAKVNSANEEPEKSKSKKKKA